jgi:hypothetical protein
MMRRLKPENKARNGRAIDFVSISHREAMETLGITVRSTQSPLSKLLGRMCNCMIASS